MEKIKRGRENGQERERGKCWERGREGGKEGRRDSREEGREKELGEEGELINKTRN